jgi:hypothetical protein
MKLPVTFAYLCAAAMLAAQTPLPPTAPDTQPIAETPSNAPILQPGTTQAAPDKRVFGVLPNYRTANASTVYTPITTKQKFTIGAKDSFDYPLFLLGAATAGLGQITNQNPSFGQGLAGYGHRLGTGYADQVIGNMLTESIYPSLLHEDPRYFRLGSGAKWSRAWYAATRVFVTRTDSGGTRFNFSEVVGNATAVAIANSYYPDGRTAADNLERLGQQIAIDSFSQVLKEFWPDVKRRFFHKHQDAK